MANTMLLKMLLFLCIIINLWMVSIDAKPCINCAFVKCSKPLNCKAGLVKHRCGCCDKCAKVMGEACGKYFGKCNQGLFCVKKSGQLEQGVCACGPNCLIYCPYGRILDKNGCPTCRCKLKSCPPVCDKYCHFGKLLDKNGCQTCVCRQKACPQLSCNVFCMFGAETDINGCDTCKCKPKPCRPLSYCSRLKCPYGISKFRDHKGCEKCLCKARPCPSVCNIFCPTGNVVDQNGCKRCTCKGKLCLKGCTNFCPSGNVYDQDGCRTCQCQPRRCPPLCKMFCLYGNEIDENGCKLCRCKPRTCGLTSCAAIKCSIMTTVYTAADGCTHCRCGQESCPASCTNIFCPTGRRLDVNGCKACACNPQLCPFESCTLSCKHGKVLDQNGCKTCKCRTQACPPPCEKFCFYGNVIDKNGCKSCQCKSKSCGVTSCAALKCSFGQIKFTGDDGCTHCKCRKCPPKCKISCPFGRRLDINGCESCACKPQGNCNSVCSNSCKYGHFIDQNGCKTCTCRTQACPSHGFCFYGHVIDKNGCKTTCLPKSCGATSCVIKCEFEPDTFTGDDGCTHCICKQPPATCPIFPAPPPGQTPANSDDDCKNDSDCTASKLCCGGGFQTAPKTCKQPCRSNCSLLKCDGDVITEQLGDGCTSCRCATN